MTSATKGDLAFKRSFLKWTSDGTIASMRVRRVTSASTRRLAAATAEADEDVSISRATESSDDLEEDEGIGFASGSWRIASPSNRRSASAPTEKRPFSLNSLRRSLHTRADVAILCSGVILASNAE